MIVQRQKQEEELLRLMVVTNAHRIADNFKTNVSLEKYLLLAHTQTALSALVAIVSFVKFKSRNTIIKLIGLVFLTSFIANISALVFINIAVLRQYVNIPYVIYVLLSFVLLSKVYHLTLRHVDLKWFVTIAVILISFSLYNLFFIQKTNPNSYANIFHSAILIVYSLLYFYVLMRDLPSLYVHHIPMFWFNSGILIFHAGAFFLFSFSSYLVNVQKNDMMLYWSFHNMLSIVQHFIVLIGMYYDLKFLKTRDVKPSQKSITSA
jgi:hypothetical protein